MYHPTSLTMNDTPFFWAPQISSGSTVPALHLISLLLVVYIYDAAEDNFKVVPGMPAGASTQMHNAQKALQLIELGMVL